MKGIVVYSFTLLSSVLCFFKVSYYIVTEHAVVTHYNSSYVSYCNFSSTRKVRRSPMYYVDIHYTSVVPFDNSFKFNRSINTGNIAILPQRTPLKKENSWPPAPATASELGPHLELKLWVDFYFYQFLSNEYRRGFVEMHFKWCSLIHDDPFFGAPMKQGRLREPCPYPPGEYHMYNMSIPSAAIPPGFPFTKGRIFANLTHNGNDVFGGYIDMELKEKRMKKT